MDANISKWGHTLEKRRNLYARAEIVARQTNRPNQLKKYNRFFVA